MKLNTIVACLSILFVSQMSHAQSNLLNAKTPDEIGKKTAAQMEADNDKPLQYGYVHDRDVLMGKMVWEIIDLDERINFPLYFPVDTANIGRDRRSLFDVLIKEIKAGRITEVYYDDYFNSKKTLSDMSSSFTYIDTTNAGREEINTFYDDYKSGRKVLDPQYIDKRELGSIDVSGYKIKGYWYFDKRQGEMKYRLLGICPVSPEAREVGTDNPDVIELFWVYFPSTRDVLHEWKAFNDKNSAMPITFDHLLNSRRFSGVIYKEENVYGDRQIQEYMKDNALNQLLESERVKEKIRNFEQDMWNY
ncbi:MAG TPA: gliding motility protein GldN [Flavobacterium sp.]|uniref:type IX secretion system ring protein PorN/GldN n=1 Tax=unclassified Flavobacterium TaxID=196869 RepID=UPI000E997C07|nr:MULTISPECIES: gliding motility protein GldN [unclassified Flavobacterium]HBI02127.1 gliding motility protein GldN [Flavobacterium sp.]HRE78502.1 gliding motility protein GldN [Flavobacterium sp.]